VPGALGLPEAERAALLRGVADVIRTGGGVVPVRYLALLLLAARNA